MEHLDMRKKVTIMLAIMASMLFASLNQTIVGTSLPRIVTVLGGMEYFNWVFTIFMLASSVTAILVGKLSDIYGRKIFILTGLGIFMVGSFLCGTAGNMIQLIIYRGIQGFGGGMIMSTAFTAVGDLFSPRERGRWQGLMSSVFGLSSVLGPTLGGYIVDHFDWHWVFWIFLPVGLVAFFLILRLFPSAETGEKKRIDYFGSLFLTFTMIPMLLAFSWAGEDYAWTSFEILGLFAISIAALTVFILIEKRTENPVLPLDLFKNKIFTLSNVIGFLIGIGMFSAIMYMPFFIQGVMGTSASKSGFVMMFMTLSMVFSSTITGQVVTRTGKYKKLALAGGLIMGIGMYLLSAMDTDTSNRMAAVNLIIVGLGLGMAFPIFNLTVQNAVSHSNLGVATASIQLFRQMGGTVGVSVMGSIMSYRMETKLAVGETTPPANTFSGLTDKLKGLDPQILLSPEQLEHLRSQIPPEMSGIFDQMIHFLREAMNFALSGVFLSGMGVMFLAVFLTLFLPEIPLRTSNSEGESPEQNPSSSADLQPQK
ncbi:MFS transporter [Kroppenstedtia guangzhouensis]|uniref:MFS transporter n=1 Tax=Kroppenstedtia guangzhouensis TaxID=1274356 RepID=A0ABQ1GZC0_9BACL|nr:MDR family MFS transporter [Kroppenstedtia guangzhouensis]GGA52694.1 MFS transporter [Kroppenstedtia guangzhouensis]